MGDMADWHLEQILDVDEFDEFYGEELENITVNTIRCKFCGKSGFTWHNFGTVPGDDIWRLTKRGKIHSCERIKK